MKDDVRKLIEYNLSLDTPDAKAFADDLAVIILIYHSISVHEQRLTFDLLHHHTDHFGFGGREPCWTHKQRPNAETLEADQVVESRSLNRQSESRRGICAWRASLHTRTLVESSATVSDTTRVIFVRVLRCYALSAETPSRVYRGTREPGRSHRY
jgi:hypothetical protein